LIKEYNNDSIPIAGASAFWPIIGEPFPIMKSFLKKLKDADVVSWHYYPTQSFRCPVAVRRARPFTFLDPKNLEEFNKQNSKVMKLKESYSPLSEIWMTETGNAQCGGQPGVSDRFIAGLWWLDQLGSAAKNNNKVVVRQTLAGSDYGLINDKTLEPNPDYWNSLLWKKLIGNKVLLAEKNKKNHSLRVYAHCTKNKTSVTLLVINLNRNKEINFTFDESLGDKKEVYLLTSNDPTSKNVFLNSKRLQLTKNKTLPKILPANSHEKEQILPPTSYAFIVFPESNVNACIVFPESNVNACK